MSGVDHEELARLIAQAIIEQSGLPAEEHKRHHDALERFIEREDRRTAFYEKVKAQVGGWAVIAVLGTLGAGAWYAAKEFIRALAKGIAS